MISIFFCLIYAYIYQPFENDEKKTTQSILLLWFSIPLYLYIIPYAPTLFFSFHFISMAKTNSNDIRLSRFDICIS